MLSYINGKFYPEDQAKISVRDRAFRLGDGAFETIYIYDAIPYLLERHLARLATALELLKIKYSVKKIAPLIKSIVEKNALTNGYIRISITRGESGFGYSAKNIKNPGIVIECEAVKKPILEPAKLWLGSYTKPSPANQPISVKIIGNINSVLARLEAEENNCFDALLLNDKKQICETSSGNIFWFIGDTLYTPKSGMVEGIARDTVLRISPFKVIKGNYKLADLRKADEVFITNIAWKILPVKALLPLNIKWQNQQKTLALKKLFEQDIKNYAAARKA